MMKLMKWVYQKETVFHSYPRAKEYSKKVSASLKVTIEPNKVDKTWVVKEWALIITEVEPGQSRFVHI